MLEFTEYRRFDAVGLADLVRKREVSRAEILQAAIERLEAVNPRLNAVSTKDFGRARTRSENATGPFAGVPFLVKDTNDLQGTPTTWGSAFYRGAIASRTDTLNQRYLDAGFVALGKTIAPELALIGTSEPLAFGAVRNPFDLSRTAGGSSGGAAAAVVSGIVPAAQGSDGGGSIRCPASACGAFGLKPTRARTPSGPVAGEGWQSLLQQHMLTRSVRDSAAILDISHGPEVGDPYQVAPPSRPFIQEVGADPGRLRIAMMTHYAEGPAIDPECMDNARSAAKLCESLGHYVEETFLPSSITVERMFRLLGTVCAVWVRSMLESRAATVGRAVTSQDVEPMTWEIYNAAKDISGVTYYQTIQEMHAVCRTVGQFFKNYDALLTPGLGKVAVPLRFMDTRGSAASVVQALAEFCPFTTVYNVTGQPAAAVPYGWTEGGLPIGIQLVTRFGDEATLLRLCAQIEQAAPWAHRYEAIT